MIEGKTGSDLMMLSSRLSVFRLEGRMTAFIGRREFITRLGGAAAWPLAAPAQHERMHRVATVTAGSDENDPDAQASRARA
jgi:hypothetical protein